MKKRINNVVKSGRAFNGAERDKGVIIHIVLGDEPNGFWGGQSLCGTEPGHRGNGWHKVNEQSTCTKCREKLTAIIINEANSIMPGNITIGTFGSSLYQRTIWDNNEKIATIDFSYLDNLDDKERYEDLFKSCKDMYYALKKVREWYEKNRERYLGEYTPICFSEALEVLMKANPNYKP